MKERITVILLTLALLAGCQSQAPAAPAAPSATDAPDMEEIIQQSVDEVVQEKMKEYEEEQKKKDEEIARLKDQLEDLTASSDASQEVPLEEADTGSSAPESQPEGGSSQAEASSQSEPEPPPQSMPAPKKTAPSSSQGFDLRNLYPGIDFEESDSGEQAEAEEDTEPRDALKSNDELTGQWRLEDALEVVQLVNEKREEHGLASLEIDENLMALARIRAEELDEKFSHERPDGTHAAQAFSGGENIAGNFTSPSAVMETWLNSEGHRNNILRERFRYIGVGCYQAPNGDFCWVQLFSPRRT